MKKKKSKSELKCEFLSFIPKEEWSEVPREILIRQIIAYEQLFTLYADLFCMHLKKD